MIISMKCKLSNYNPTKYLFFNSYCDFSFTFKIEYICRKTNKLVYGE